MPYGLPVQPSISVSPASIRAGESVSVTWNCENATLADVFIQRGTPSNASLASGLSGSVTSGPLTATTMFQVNCAANVSAPWVWRTAMVMVTPAAALAPLAASQSVPAAASQAAPSTGGLDPFVSAVSTGINSSKIQNVALAASGKQNNAIGEAEEVAEIGAGQAATMGAIFCAEGANVNLKNPEEAAEFYKTCQENFTVAHAMAPKSEGFRVDEEILKGKAAQGSLQQFEQNFGVPQEEYLSRMLGKEGGLKSMADIAGRKLPDEQLAQAMGAAKDLGLGENSAQEKKAPVVKFIASTSLRDSLKKKLNEGLLPRRDPASVKAAVVARPAPAQLEDVPIENLLGMRESEEGELSLFDVVHMKYNQVSLRLNHR